MKDYIDYIESQIKGESCPLGEFQKSTYNGLSALPKETPTTMAFIPFQTDNTLYEFATAFTCGTAFPNLNKPFLGGECI